MFSSLNQALLRLALLASLLAGCASTTATPDAKSTLPEPTRAAAATGAPLATATQNPTEAPTAAKPEAQASGVPAAIRSLKMFSQQVGWAIDLQGRILRTEAGVATWRDVTPEEARPEADTTRAVAAFLDEDEAWSIFYMDQPPAMAAGVDVWHTSDGGASWEKLGSIPPYEEMNVAVQMEFVDAEHGWLLGQIYPGMQHVYAELFATADGGQTWELVSDSTPAGDKPEGETLEGSYSLPAGDRVFTFITPDLGFAAVKDLAHTTDGGKTWAIQPLPDLADAPELEQPYSFVSPPQFSSQNDGAFIYSLYDFNQVACPPCDIFDGVPAMQALYVTHDGGKTWSPLPAPAALGTVNFLNADTGWYLGIEAESQDTTTLFATLDGGANWTVVSAQTGLPLGTRLEFVSDQVGFATNPHTGRGLENLSLQGLAGVDPYLYQTIDGGETWTQVDAVVGE